MSKLQGKVIGGFLLCGVIFSLAACGNGSESDVSGKKMFYSSINNSVEREETETEADEYDISNENYKEGYLITKVNSVQETIQVYSYEDEAEYIYHYGMKSEFYNKYGNHAVVSDFSPGDVVSIDGTDEDGRITNISKSGDVWVYDDIVRFNTNPEDNVLTIADTKYDISDDTFIFSLEDRITLKDIAKDDALWVVGAGTKILSSSDEYVKSGVWLMNALDRGYEIERALGGMVNNFPTIDKFKVAWDVAGTKWLSSVTSIKSIDTTLKTYQDSSKFYSKLKRYVDDLIGFDDVKYKGVWHRIDCNTDRVLELAIPPVELSSEQADVLQQIANYASEFGIEFITRIVE